MQHRSSQSLPPSQDRRINSLRTLGFTHTYLRPAYRAHPSFIARMHAHVRVYVLSSATNAGGIAHAPRAMPGQSGRLLCLNAHRFNCQYIDYVTFSPQCPGLNSWGRVRVRPQSLRACHRLAEKHRGVKAGSLSRRGSGMRQGTMGPGGIVS